MALYINNLSRFLKAKLLIDIFISDIKESKYVTERKS